ncbi:MAG: hypothetical protein GDA56_23110 [Hormoscilla sp. GM7CHS1pb]|nr:hypothetical protein [Hormoscilla sp. GM7CHS1pb]
MGIRDRARPAKDSTGQPDLESTVYCNQSQTRSSRGQHPQDLLSTPEEFDRVFPSEEKLFKRGDIPKGEIDESTYIKNISKRILIEPAPQSASQKGGLFAKLKAFLFDSTPSS